MPERVGHELRDHKLRHIAARRYSPLLQRHAGEFPGLARRFGLGAERAAGRGRFGKLAIGGVRETEGLRAPQRQAECPGGAKFAMPARREEAVVAHDGVLRPDYGDRQGVYFTAPISSRSLLARPGCKRYHHACNLQAQGLMHVQMTLYAAHATRAHRGTNRIAESRGGQSDLY